MDYSYVLPLVEISIAISPGGSSGYARISTLHGGSASKGDISVYRLCVDETLRGRTLINTLFESQGFMSRAPHSLLSRRGLSGYTGPAWGHIPRHPYTSFATYRSTAPTHASRRAPWSGICNSIVTGATRPPIIRSPS